MQIDNHVLIASQLMQPKPDEMQISKDGLISLGTRSFSSEMNEKVNNQI